MRILVVAALALVIANPAMARSHVCQAAVDKELSRLGITLDRVTSTEVGRERTGSEDGVLFAYKYWMRMSSCKKGHLIMDLDLSCGIKSTYTDGPCEISGVPHC